MPTKEEALKRLIEDVFKTMVDSELLEAKEPALIVAKFGVTPQKAAAGVSQYAKKPWEDGVLQDYVKAELLRAGVGIAAMIPKTDAERLFKRRFLGNLEKIQSDKMVEYLTKQLDLACRVLFGPPPKK